MEPETDRPWLPEIKALSEVEPYPREYDKIRGKISIIPDEADYRVLNLSDPHAPYVCGSLIQQAIEMEMAKDYLPPIKYVVYGADSHAWDELSSFVRTTRDSLIKEALAQSRFILKYLSDRWPVYLIVGNHDRRPERMLAKFLPPDVVKDLKDIAGVRQWMTSGLNSKHPVVWLDYHIVKFDDVAFTHFDRASVVHGRTATWAADHVANQELYNDTDGEPILPGPRSRAVIQGHNHRVTGGIMYNGMWCIEAGCLTPLADYALYKAGNHGRYELFQKGYAVATVRNHRVDCTETRGVPLDDFRR